MDVKSPVNDNDKNDNINSEHLLCGKHCAPNVWANFISATTLWDIMKLEAEV